MLLCYNAVFLSILPAVLFFACFLCIFLSITVCVTISRVINPVSGYVWSINLMDHLERRFGAKFSCWTRGNHRVGAAARPQPWNIHLVKSLKLHLVHRRGARLGGGVGMQCTAQMVPRHHYRYRLTTKESSKESWKIYICPRSLAQSYIVC